MAKQLRVMMAMKSFSVGGIQTYVYTVTKTLLEMGVSVTVAASMMGSLYDSFVKLGCELRIEDFDNPTLLEQWIRKGRYHVINVHHAALALMISAAVARHRVPIVYTVHYRGTDVLVLKDIVANFISVSPPLQTWLHMNGINSTIVPNPIDLEMYKDIGMGLRSTFGVGAEAPVLLYAARMSRKKGKICRMLLEAAETELFETFPDLHLFIAGDGPKAKEIHRLVKKSKYLDRLHLLGFVADMTPLYSMTNAVVGTGRTALEAMACERIVIAVGVKGDAGIIAPNLYEYAWQRYYGDHRADWRASAESIAAASRIIISSPELQRMWGPENRAEVIRRFDRKRITEQLLTAFKRIRRKYHAR